MADGSEQTKRLEKIAAATRQFSTDGRWARELLELSRRQDATDASVKAIEEGGGAAMCGACGSLLNPDCGRAKNAAAMREPFPCRPMSLATFEKETS